MLGETQLSSIISELEGNRVVQLFSQDLQQHEGDEAQRQFLRELFQPQLAPGQPEVLGEDKGTQPPPEAEGAGPGWRVIGASQALGDAQQRALQ